MKKIFLIIPLIVFSFLFVEDAKAVDFIEDVILDLTGLTETVYIAAGSKAGSLTIAGTDLTVSQILAAPDFFSLKTIDTDPILKLIPTGGTADLVFSSDDFSAGYISQWTENSSVSVEHLVGVPNASTPYTIKVDGVFFGVFNSGLSSEITFTRTGNGIAEVFTVEGSSLCTETHNVWGWAWSENIGWISFSCKNENNPINYGVDIDEAGNFSGHAWSENIGWVSFERSETGPPPEAPDFGTHLAEVDIITGKVSGWARALSACQDNLWNGTNCTGSGAGDKSGGWNGWIKLRGPSISTSGLLASWSMDENSGTQILDSSGNDNTGNFGLGSKAPTWDDGKYNSGLQFDGNNDYIGFTGINTAKTQEAWIYLTQSAPDKGNVNHLFNNFYQHYANDYFYFNGTNDYIPWVPTINTWYHLVLIYTDKADTGTAKLYVNGVPYNAAQQVGPHAIQSIGTISYPVVNTAFAGIIDEVRIYDRVLTDEEILAHYNGYGVDIDKDTGDFSNYSWSNMIIGWTSFNSIDTGSPINYKVQTFFNFDRAPEIQNLNYSSPTTCSFEMSIPIFSWDYSDEDDVPLGTDPQTIYQIRIDNDSTFGVDANDDPILDGDEYRCSGSLCEVTTPVHSFSPQPAEWISWTDYGQTYYWKARVKDSNGKWSSWSSSVSFITQAHPYSEPNFSSAPEIIVVNEDVNFTDLSTCYYSSGVDYDCKDEPVNLYAWDFDGNLTVDSTTRGDVTYQYTSSGSYIAILEIKDDVGTCDIQVPLGALVPLPEYKEVAPTSYFGGLFADVLHFFKNLLFS